MSIQHMQVFVDGDAIAVGSLRRGQACPASTMDMESDDPFVAYISLHELFDPKMRDWVVAQLIPTVMPQMPEFNPLAQPWTITGFKGTKPVREAIRAYHKLQERYEHHPRWMASR